MAGMFSAPCCLTCEHAFTNSSESVAPQPWGCRFHGRQLPVWLDQWKTHLAICQHFRYSGASEPGIAAEFIRLYYADSNVLYCYKSEYHLAKFRSELALIDQLPPLNAERNVAS
jgi:hypothetical protein